ncbi:MAG TPA: GNAT family N-acetyltransferase [Gaiellaceae bacterium]|nr:GNAT family N-acetyltransferase [Gaiellaceae bacterium]
MEIRVARDEDAEAVAAILREVDDARVLSAAGWLHNRRTTSPRDRMLRLVAADDEVVAVGQGALNTWTSTAGAGWCSVAVTGTRRCEGIGSALLEALLRHLREAGATKATSFMRFSEEGERWASARGWSRVLTGPLIAVDPRGVPASPAPPGIRCGPMAEAPPEAVYDALLDAARDEPRPDPFDSMPYDDFLNDWAEPDLDLESSAVAWDGGRIVALSEVRVGGDRAQHGFTGTRRDYRGRGLATAVKCTALRAAAARGVKRVTTSNAEENAPMRAINRKLGFEPIGEHVIVGRDLT